MVFIFLSISDQGSISLSPEKVKNQQLSNIFWEYRNGAFPEVVLKYWFDLKTLFLPEVSTVSRKNWNWHFYGKPDV